MPVKASRGAAWRTITADEVRDWFGKSTRSRLGEAQYRHIADYLTKIRWPSDPDEPLGSPAPPNNSEPDEYWNFNAATDAAKLLLESFPGMLTHWQGLLWAPETRGGFAAIKTLQDALIIALPYIEWPFGYLSLSETKSGRIGDAIRPG